MTEFTLHVDMAKYVEGFCGWDMLLLLEDLQIVLSTFESPNTKITSPTFLSQCTTSQLTAVDLSLIEFGTESIQISISHPTYTDIMLNATLSKPSRKPALVIISSNASYTSQITELNHLLPNFQFSSLMEACMQTFQLLDESIHSIIEHVVSTPQENINKNCHITVLSIDHMNDEKRYLGNVKDFCKQSGVHILVFILGRITFVVLGNEKRDSECFIQLLRTVNVDVNKRRKPCKERMMKILEQYETSEVGIPDTLIGETSIHRNISQEQVSTILSDFRIPHKINSLVS